METWNRSIREADHRPEIHSMVRSSHEKARSLMMKIVGGREGERIICYEKRSNGTYQVHFHSFKFKCPKWWDTRSALRTLL